MSARFRFKTAAEQAASWASYSKILKKLAKAHKQDEEKRVALVMGAFQCEDMSRWWKNSVGCKPHAVHS